MVPSYQTAVEGNTMEFIAKLLDAGAEGLDVGEIQRLAAAFRAEPLAQGDALPCARQAAGIAVLARGRLDLRLARGPDRQARHLLTLDAPSVLYTAGCWQCCSASIEQVAAQPCLVGRVSSEDLDRLRRDAPRGYAALLLGLGARLAARLSATLRALEGAIEARSRSAPPPGSGTRSHGDPPRRYRGTPPLSEPSPFAFLDDEALHALARVAPLQRWEPGRWLLGEGQRGATCFLLAAGEVDVVRTMAGRRRRLETVGPGAVLAQAALITRRPALAGLRARGPAVAYALHESVLRHQAERASPLALALLDELARAGSRQIRAAEAKTSRLWGAKLSEPCWRPLARDAGALEPPEDDLDPDAMALRAGLDPRQLERVEVVEP